MMVMRGNVRVEEEDEPYRKSSTATIRSEGTGTVYYNKHGGILQLYDSSDNSSLDSHRSSMVKIRRVSSTFDGTSRFPKLQECAHFHYDFVELGKIKVCLCDEEQENYKHNGEEYMERTFLVKVLSNNKSWNVRRTYKNFRLLDRQLHKCIFDRKFSQLVDLSQPDDSSRTYEEMETELGSYLQRFTNIANSMINCGTILNWFELDNRGNRLLAIDDSGINTPAIAAAHAVKRYTAQAVDEISLEVGDIVSVIDMHAAEDTMWWRGKRGFEVGFFPSECVELIGDKVPSSVENRIPLNMVRKHGKFLSFLRMFFTTRPARNQLKQTGIVKERVFGCDLGEHLLNSGHDVPLVLKSCSEVIEQHGIVDGIYRLSGITSNIQKLRIAFDEDRVPDLRADIYLQDIHSISSLLKMYFRELPNPLLTYQLYDKFAEAVRDEDNKLWKIHDVVQQLPPPHYRTLEYLMKHLAKVSTNGHDTGMHSKNLAIVWAPNLLRSKELESGGGAAALQGVGIQAVVTECLIVYADLIFSDKMPSYNSPEFTQSRKKPRPKSLAISTPTKLITLEEARERALSASLRPPSHKYINVGAGPDNLPSKYHTVIDLPGYKKKIPLKDNTSANVKGKKSPGSWRSIFTRSSGRGSMKYKGGKSVPEDILMCSEKKAITEEDVHNWKRRRLRVAKSAESLINLPNRDHRMSRHFDDFPRINSCSDEEMSPRTKHKRSASSESPRCLISDSYPSFIEPGSREVPIDVEMTSIDSSSSIESAADGKKGGKTERNQSFVRGDEKRKPTHRRTPSGSASSTPRKEVKERATPPKEKKNITKPVAQSEKLRRKNENAFEKENVPGRDKLVQQVAKSLKLDEKKAARGRLDSSSDKEKFVLHVEDVTVLSSKSPKALGNKTSSTTSLSKQTEGRNLSSEKLKESSSPKDKQFPKTDQEIKKKKSVQQIGNLPESPGARRKNWINTSPATSPDEPPPGFYSPNKSDYSDILHDDENSKRFKQSLPKFPNLQDSLNDTGRSRSDVSPGGYDNLDSPFSSSDFHNYESSTSTSTALVYKQHSYEEEEYDNNPLYPDDTVSPPFTSKMSKCLSVPSDIQKSLENLTSGSQTDLLSSVTISELSTSVDSVNASVNDDVSKVHKNSRRSASLDSLNDTESPLTRTLKEINAQIDKAFKTESHKAQKIKQDGSSQGRLNDPFDFSSDSANTIKRQSSSSENLESHVYTDRPGAEIQVVETPQLVRKAVRPSQISQSKKEKMETNIDADLYMEHTKEISVNVHHTSEKVQFGLSDEDLRDFENYKAETGYKIDLSEEDFEFFTKQARSNQSSKRHSVASSIASPLSDISPGEYRRRIVSPTCEKSTRWKNIDRSDGENTTPTNSPPIAQKPGRVCSPSKEDVQYSPITTRPKQIRTPSQEEIYHSSPSAPHRMSKVKSPSQEEISHASPSVIHRSNKIRTPSQEELYHGSPVTHRPNKVRTPSQEDVSHASPLTQRPSKARPTLQNPTSPPSTRFVENPIYTGVMNTSPKSPPAKMIRHEHFTDNPKRLETAIDDTLFQNTQDSQTDGKDMAERKFEKLLFKTSQRVDGENAVVQSPRSPRQQPRWEDLAGLNQVFVADTQSPKSTKFPKNQQKVTNQQSLESPDEFSFDKKLQDLSNFSEQWRTQLAPTGDVCRLGSQSERLNEIQNSETKIEVERPSLQKLTETINKNYGFYGERTLRRSSTVAAIEHLEEYEPRVRQKTPECSTDEQTLTLEKPMIKRCQTESNIPQIKHCTVVTQDTSSTTSSSANSEPTNIEYEPTDFGKVLKTNFTGNKKSAVDCQKHDSPVTSAVTLPPSYPVMASSQTCHFVNKDVPMETVIDDPYLNDQQILAEVMPFNSVIDDIDFNESCFGIPTHQNLSNEMREKIQERLKAERDQNSDNIPENSDLVQYPFNDPRTPTHNVQMMEIETHFSADPYQLPVATVHFLSQGPVVHASPQVIEKLDNSEEAAQNAINADLELSMSLQKSPEFAPEKSASVLESEVVGVSNQVISQQQENARNTGLENMRLVTPFIVKGEENKIKKSDFPELPPPSREYIEVYRPVLVRRKHQVQPKIDGSPSNVKKTFSKPPLQKAYTVDYYRSDCVAMDSCDEDTCDDVFVDHNKIKGQPDVTVSVQCNVKCNDAQELQNLPLTFLAETPSRSSLDDSALEMASSRHDDFLSENGDDSQQYSKLQSLKQKFESESAKHSQMSNTNVCIRHENFNSERMKEMRFAFTKQRSYSQTEQYSSDFNECGSFSSQVSGQILQTPGSRRSISTDLGYEFHPKKIEKVTIGITNFGKPPKHRGSSRGRASSESAMSESEMTIRVSSARTSPKTIIDGSPKSVRTSPKVLRPEECSPKSSRGSRSPQSQRNVDLSLRFVRQKSEAGSPKSIRHVSFSENSEMTKVTLTSPTNTQSISETVFSSESQTHNRMSQSMIIPNGSEKSRKVERRGSIKELMQFFEEKTGKKEESAQEESPQTSQLRHCPRVRSESPNYCQTESRRNETYRHSLEIPPNSSYLEGLVRPHPVRLGPKPFYGAKQ